MSDLLSLGLKDTLEDIDGVLADLVQLSIDLGETELLVSP